MAKRILFNKFEAAILLDYYIKCNDGKISKETAIETVSKKLRKIAENRGIKIDNNFRTFAGIKFQMMSMESAYKGFTIVKPASKLFSETVKMFIENRNQFNDILKQADEMAK